MTVMPTARDYSLIGRDGRLAVENGLAAAEWYHTDIPRKEMKELMKREDGPAIRDTILWLGLFLVFGGLDHRALAVLVGGAAALRLRHALRLDRRLALARVRPRHRLQDPLDERRRLPVRLLHDHARARDLALVAHPPPHRHHHRRPRPGDRRDAAAARSGDILVELLRDHRTPRRRPGASSRHASGRLERGGEDLRPRDASGRRSIRTARIWLAIHLVPDRARARARLLAAGAARRPAADDVRRLVRDPRSG